MCTLQCLDQLWGPSLLILRLNPGQPQPAWPCVSVPHLPLYGLRCTMSWGSIAQLVAHRGHYFKTKKTGRFSWGHFSLSHGPWWPSADPNPGWQHSIFGNLLGVVGIGGSRREGPPTISLKPSGSHLVQPHPASEGEAGPERGGDSTPATDSGCCGWEHLRRQW